MIRRIKIVIFCGIVIAAIILLFMGEKLFISYGLGFGFGCVNFAFMAMSFNKMLSLKSIKIVPFQILSYFLRYVCILLGMIKAASSGVIGVTLFTGGLLTVNFLYIVSSYSKNRILQGK